MVQTQNGGARVTFARHAGDWSLDVEAALDEAELYIRRALKRIQMARARTRVFRESAESHERALAGRRTALCGTYECTDPSCAELICLEQVRRAGKPAA